MPAMLDDPTSPPIYRTSGQAPYPQPYSHLPPDVVPRPVTLRDRVTTATLLPFSSSQQVPPALTACLSELFNREIENGDTYPMIEGLPLRSFESYWFANFGAIMVLGDIHDAMELMEMEERGVDWAKECLGSFYIKPNYPGRSSHVCNGGFIVTDAARNRGVGRLMGEGYLEWAPKLGYTYSVFNLVYETNVASLRIWDALGFKRIGRVKGCGNLKSHPGQYIDAIIFGRELGGDGEDVVSEERFDKIRFYLKTGSYPNGSDRAEKSRLRSAATHYRLIPSMTGNEEDDKLMLKGKEVISDPHRQYEIARTMHSVSHGGINKTTATIADKFHWVRIKETVSAAIRNCPDCKDSGPKPAASSSAPVTGSKRAAASDGSANSRVHSNRITVTAGSDDPADAIAGAGASSPSQRPPPVAPMSVGYSSGGVADDYNDMPVDPQIIQSMHGWVGAGARMDGSNAKVDDVSARLQAELESQMRDDDEAAFRHQQQQQQRQASSMQGQSQ